MELDGPTTKPQPPCLTLRAEFEKAIVDYKPSEHARRVIRDVAFAVMTGPTAAGRNTIILKLLETERYHFVVSDTTRPKRQNDGVWEEDGKQYWFRSETELLQDLQAGEFLEAEIIHNQQISGISVRELERASQGHKIAITDVDIEGVSNALRAKGDTFALLVFPPDFATWQQRLAKRSAMAPAELRRRLETAARIFELPSQDDRYHVVINDTIEHAVKQVRGIVEQGKIDAEFQRRAHVIASKLHADTRAFLDTLEF